MWKRSLPLLMSVPLIAFWGCGSQGDTNGIEEETHALPNDLNQTETNTTDSQEENLTETTPIVVTWYQPHPTTTWQWQLTETLNTSYDVELYDIDLYNTSTETIEQLQDEGRKVICYFSAGSYENWREDAINFPEEALGNILDGWENERWLDIRDERVKSIMQARLDLAVHKGCDGVEPDNVDAYLHANGFELTALDQQAYNIFLAMEAHDRNLSIGLKNDLQQIEVLEPYFDFAINEQCYFYQECDTLQPFIEANKAVFNAEYANKYVNNIRGERDRICQTSHDNTIRTLVLPQTLDDTFRYSCDE